MGTAGVGVVFGGQSPEHEVSLASARGVIENAQLLGWDLLPVGVGRDGTWHLGPGALHVLWQQSDQRRIPGRDTFQAEPGPVVSYPALPPTDAFAGFPVVLPVTHGGWGEDGTLQQMLLAAGLHLIGCGPQASADCLDKARAKSVLAEAGIPVTRGTVVPRAAADAPDLPHRLVERVGPPPWFVKPQSGGSSVGISRVDSPDDVRTALQRALVHDESVVVEQLVPHRELVVGIVGRSSLIVSPPGECRPVGDLYTYEEKYAVGNPLFTCPADLDSVTTEEARALADAAYRALNCDVFARVDLFLDQQTGKLLVNEVNTIPGMTSTSVFPKVMRAAGLDYPNLLHALHAAALE